jgi:phosphate:Na+ symporter
MFKPDLTYEKADLLASLIEEEDWSASLGETLYQIARRVERQHFSPSGRALVDTILTEVSDAMKVVTQAGNISASADASSRLSKLQMLREQSLKADLPWAERGAILTLLGSAERAFLLIERIKAERQSVLRPAVIEKPVRPPEAAGGIAPVAVPS